MTRQRDPAATKRAIRSEADERAASDGFWFDERAADHVQEFIEGNLRHTIGEWAGKRLILLDWQRDDFIRPLFGWMDADGFRRFRSGYIEIPKKNGKSTICSALALYLLAGDGEAGSRVYCAASDKKQAGIVYHEASTMAKASPLLAPYISPSDSTKHLALPSTNSYLTAVSREFRAQEGLNIHGLIFDELHAQKTRDLWDALRYGGASRRQHLRIAITTAGFDRRSICYEQHVRSRAILEGRIYDPTAFALIYAVDEEAGEDWQDPAMWRKANPSLGHTIQLRDFEQQAQEAAESPTKTNTFKRYRLNIWTQQAVLMIPMDAWDSCGSEDFPDDELEDRPCYVGVDLAARNDLTAVVLLFPWDDDSVRIVPYFFFPADRLEDSERDIQTREAIRAWSLEGLVTLMPGDTMDSRTIREFIAELGDRHDIVEIAFDPWSAREMGVQLGEDGDGFETVEFRQSFTNYHEPIEKLLAMLTTGKLAHRDHPVLRWQAGNCAAKSNSQGLQMPDKASSGEKIDGIVAMLMALGRYIVRETDSVYDSEGLRVL